MGSQSARTRLMHIKGNKLVKMSLFFLFGGFLTLFLGHSKANDAERNDAVSSVTHHQILIHNFSFEPKKLVVDKGDKITWINKDFAPHNITAEFGENDQGERTIEKYSSDLPTDGEFTMTVSDGFDYFCGLHPSMKGEILVNQ